MANTTDPTDDPETIKNELRGCGYLKPKSAYLRSGVPSEDGVLPAFVRFDPFIPYLERDKFRSFESFPGIQFELSVTGPPVNPSDPSVFSPEVETTAESIAKTNPEGEIHNHLRRLSVSGEGTHAGEFEEFHATDLFMFVGASYYNDPEEFIREVKTQGLSKKIPLSESTEAPTISKGRTRLFLVHPKALDEDGDGENEQAAVIGYVYLTRTVFTEDVKGRYPAWAQKKAREGEIDLVQRGPQINEEGTVMTTWEDEIGGDDDSEFTPPSEEGSIEVLDEYLREGLPGMFEQDSEADPEPAADEEGLSEELDVIQDYAAKMGVSFEEAEVELEDDDGEIDPEALRCEFCRDVFKSPMARVGHLRACPEKPSTETGE